MLSTQEQKRYSRQIILPELGISGQEKLKNARVLVIGAGGLGCPVLQYLAAAGVGNIGIVDYDNVDISNLHRQILYSDKQLGKNKAFCAAEAVSLLNPGARISPYNINLTNVDALELLSAYEIIIDGTDNFATRYMVNDACYILKKPLVFGAISKFDGQVCVFNLSSGSPTYRNLFPEPPDPETIPSCAESGVLGVLPGIIGSLMAAEAIKIICGIGKPLDGILLSLDILGQLVSKVNISSIEKERLQPGEAEFLSMDYQFSCSIEETDVPWISREEVIQNRKKYTVYDIREPYEYMADPELNAMNIPYSSILSGEQSLENTKPIVLTCSLGIKSKLLAREMNKKVGNSRVFYLK